MVLPLSSPPVSSSTEESIASPGSTSADWPSPMDDVPIPPSRPSPRHRHSPRTQSSRVIYERELSQFRIEHLLSSSTDSDVEANSMRRRELQISPLDRRNTTSRRMIRGASDSEVLRVEATVLIRQVSKTPSNKLSTRSLSHRSNGSTRSDSSARMSSLRKRAHKVRGNDLVTINESAQVSCCRIA